MRLFEMKGRFPIKIGRIKLKFSEKYHIPALDRGTIYIPIDNLCRELFFLKNGEQFIFVTGSAFGNVYYFGGVRYEIPFLYTLSHEAFDVFMTNGEEKFYEFLEEEKK